MLIEEIRRIKSDHRDLRNFGFVVGGVLLALAALLFWKERPAWTWLGGIGASLVTLGAILPGFLMPFQKVWMTLAVIMGWVMTRVILSALFFLVLTPIGLVAHATGQRFLDRSLDRDAASYWHAREDHPPPREDYEKQY